jgi:hypothetical protein
MSNFELYRIGRYHCHKRKHKLMLHDIFAASALDGGEQRDRDYGHTHEFIRKSSSEVFPLVHAMCCT